MHSRFAALASLLLAVTLSEPAWGQEPVKPAGTNEPKFLGLDLFGGGGAYQRKKTQDGSVEKATSDIGWDLGATVLTHVRWVGITGTIGQTISENIKTTNVLFGPRFYIGNPGARWIAHALVGFARTTGSTSPHTSAEVVLGGGLDIFIFRLQGDYVRMDVPGFPKNNARFSGGVAIPLCLRACRHDDYSNFGSFGR